MRNVRYQICTSDYLFCIIYDASIIQKRDKVTYRELVFQPLTKQIIKVCKYNSSIVISSKSIIVNTTNSEIGGIPNRCRTNNKQGKIGLLSKWMPEG